MQQKLEVLLFAAAAGLLALGAWIYSLTKKNKEQALKNNQLAEKNSSLTKTVSGLIELSHTLEVTVGGLGEILVAPDGRKRLHELFVGMGNRLSRDELSVIQQNAWAKSKPALESVYMLKFESDFNKLTENAGIQELVQFTTTPFDLDVYMDTHLEFTVKSMTIIKNAIASVRSYSELNDMVTLLKGWPPFAYWGTDIFKWVDEKAVTLSEKELKANRNSLLEQFQNLQWSKEKANRLEELFDNGVEILKRDLYSEEARLRFKKTYTPDLKRVLNTLGEHTATSNTVAGKLLRLNKVWKEEELDTTKENTPAAAGG